MLLLLYTASNITQVAPPFHSLSPSLESIDLFNSYQKLLLACTSKTTFVTFEENPVDRSTHP